MTPEKWQRCADPQQMLRLLQGRVADRQVRLLLCACCRARWDQLRDERSRQAVAVAERFADEQGDERGLQAAYRGALAALHETWGDRVSAEAIQLPSLSELVAALRKARGGRVELGFGPSRETQEAAVYAQLAMEAADPLVGVGSAVALAELALPPELVADLLREVFNPFRRSPVAPAALAWCGGAGRRLAEAIYDGRRFEDLPVLADLLEEAGLTDAGLLGHLRGPGPHVLGCWAVDAVLGRS
jgi:hypothetical protein